MPRTDVWMIQIHDKGSAVGSALQQHDSCGLPSALKLLGSVNKNISRTRKNLIATALRLGLADRAVVLRIEPASRPFQAFIPDAYALRLSVAPAAPMR